MRVSSIALAFMVLSFMVWRNKKSSAAESAILFMAGLLFWASGIGTLFWVVTDGIWQETQRGSEGTPVVLALVFLALAWLVVRSRRNSSAESAILFMGGLFFWYSGIGVTLWALVLGVWHAMGGGH